MSTRQKDNLIFGIIFTVLFATLIATSIATLMIFGKLLLIPIMELAIVAGLFIVFFNVNDLFRNN
jgi:uncharacterized membrane protein YdjX (TVP38/TMEM64 family)